MELDDADQSNLQKLPPAWGRWLAPGSVMIGVGWFFLFLAWLIGSDVKSKFPFNIPVVVGVVTFLIGGGLLVVLGVGWLIARLLHAVRNP